jgi:hypothetical protein
MGVSTLALGHAVLSVASPYSDASRRAILAKDLSAAPRRPYNFITASEIQYLVLEGNAGIANHTAVPSSRTVGKNNLVCFFYRELEDLIFTAATELYI